METLRALVDRDSLEVPAFALDRFQSRVLDHLHLEFFLARCRVILTPHLSFLVTGEATEAEERGVQAILDESHELLDQLKLYLLYELSLNSALLETNSYHIAVNDHLLISRFLRYEQSEDFELKLYTVPPRDLIEHYGDRIYLGRDLVSLAHPRRPHLGLGYLRRSLPQQVEKLELRLRRDATSERADLQTGFFGDLEEIVEEFARKADAILNEYPAELGSDRLDRDRLLDVNDRFRELKHVLSEGEALLREVEQECFAAGSHAARYVTKLRKDLTNMINYIMLKVNGRISDALNGIQV
jgi:hypothetical protein